MPGGGHDSVEVLVAHLDVTLYHAVSRRVARCCTGSYVAHPHALYGTDLAGLGFLTVDMRPRDLGFLRQYDVHSWICKEALGLCSDLALVLTAVEKKQRGAVTMTAAVYCCKHTCGCRWGSLCGAPRSGLEVAVCVLPPANIFHYGNRQAFFTLVFMLLSQNP